MLVTPEQVKEHLLIDHDHDDAKLATIAEEASHVMLNYLKKAEDWWQDSSGEPVDVPGTITAATLKVAAALYENRDGSPNATPALSQDVMDMVHRYRDPALA